MTQEDTKVEAETVELKKDETLDQQNDPEPTTDQKLVKQVEYYFGDANLPYDKFIKIELAKNNGWFQADLLLKFNKINSILSDIPEEDRIKTILEALGSSILIEVDESNKKIRRNPEMPLPSGNSDSRSVYLKGFHKSETKLDALIEHYKKYEGMEAVIMRYYKEKVLVLNEPNKEGDTVEGTGEPKPKYEAVEDKIAWVKKFKGSIFVVFKTEEQAKAAMDDITTYGGNQLIKMLQSDYKAQKAKEYKARMESRLSKKRKAPEGEEDKDDKEASGEPAAAVEEEFMKGTLVKVTEIPDGYTREVLKEKWYKATDADKFDIAFIDFQRGDKQGVLRLSRAGAAKEALELLKDGQFSVEENVFIKVSGFEEEDEKTYQVKIQADRNRFKKGRGGGNRGRGGRGRGRGRGGGGRGGKRGRF